MGHRTRSRTYAGVPPCSLVVHGLRVTFETGRVEAVVTITELHHSTDGIAHGRVVVRDKIFQRLHKSPLHVTSLGSLDSSVDKTFTTRDGVEQELGRGEAGVETVPHEPLRRRVARLLGEVRKRTVLEAVGHTMTSDNLLSDTGNHLGDVDDGTYAV